MERLRRLAWATGFTAGGVDTRGWHRGPDQPVFRFTGRFAGRGQPPDRAGAKKAAPGAAGSETQTQAQAEAFTPRTPQSVNETHREFRCFVLYSEFQRDE